MRIARLLPNHAWNAYHKLVAKRASKELVEMFCSTSCTGEVDKAYVDKIQRCVKAEQDKMDKEDNKDLPW